MAFPLAAQSSIASYQPINHGAGAASQPASALTPHSLTTSDYLQHGASACAKLEGSFCTQCSSIATDLSAQPDSPEVHKKVLDAHFSDYSMQAVPLPSTLPRTQGEWHDFMWQNGLDSLVLVNIEGDKPRLTTLVRDQSGASSLHAWTNWGDQKGGIGFATDAAFFNALARPLNHGNTSAFAPKSGDISANSEEDTRKAEQEKIEAEKQARDKKDAQLQADRKLESSKLDAQQALATKTLEKRKADDAATEQLHKRQKLEEAATAAA